MPKDRASSLTANLTYVASSAASMARRAARLSSTRPGAASVCTALSSTPNSSRAGRSSLTNESSAAISVAL